MNSNCQEHVECIPMKEVKIELEKEEQEVEEVEEEQHAQQQEQQEQQQLQQEQQEQQQLQQEQQELQQEQVLTNSINDLVFPTSTKVATKQSTISMSSSNFSFPSSPPPTSSTSIATTPTEPLYPKYLESCERRKHKEEYFTPGGKHLKNVCYTSPSNQFPCLRWGLSLRSTNVKKSLLGTLTNTTDNEEIEESQHRKEFTKIEKQGVIPKESTRHVTCKNQNQFMIGNENQSFQENCEIPRNLENTTTTTTSSSSSSSICSNKIKNTTTTTTPTTPTTTTATTSSSICCGNKWTSFLDRSKKKGNGIPFKRIDHVKKNELSVQDNSVVDVNKTRMEKSTIYLRHSSCRERKALSFQEKMGLKIHIKYKEVFNLAVNTLKKSTAEMEVVVKKVILDLPVFYHGELYRISGDRCKQLAEIDLARKYYEKATNVEPHQVKIWLERARLEMEMEDWTRYESILYEALDTCGGDESLLIKLIQFETFIMGRTLKARNLLSRIEFFPIKNSIKVIMEGCLLEYRCGNISLAREILFFLRKNANWCGAVYVESIRLEEKTGNYKEALQLAEEAIQALPRYGPIWFAALRLVERMQLNDVGLLDNWVHRAVQSISSELVWKIHLEQALLEYRRILRLQDHSGLSFSMCIFRGKKALDLCFPLCPEHLRWKILSVRAKLEYLEGNSKKARETFIQACESLDISKNVVLLLEFSRFEELLGHRENSLDLLQDKNNKSYNNSKSFRPKEVKVCQELILFHGRGHEENSKEKALKEAKKAIEENPRSSRLWACCIHAAFDEANQLSTFHQALHQLPKSGEIWCEGARIYMNPCTQVFNLHQAQLYLEFAIQFTPQYGDSYIELLRLFMLQQVLAKPSQGTNTIEPQREEQEQEMYTNNKEIETNKKYIETNKKYIETNIKEMETKGRSSTLSSLNRNQLYLELYDYDFKEMALRCDVAEPNCGSLWSFCKEHHYSTPQEVLVFAKNLLAKELSESFEMYRNPTVRPDSLDRFRTALIVWNTMDFFKLSTSQKLHLLYGAH